MKKWLPVLEKALARGLWLTTMTTALAFGGSATFCWGKPSDQTYQISILSSDSWQTSQLINPRNSSNRFRRLLARSRW
jgi:hypothetical protein